MSCPAGSAPFRCPSVDDLVPQVLALLPRGKAWGDGGPRPGTVLYGYFRAVAELFGFANSRLCALREEFWCATRAETDDLWMAEYGLPDACDPFPDLCAKVRALGGTRCEYFVEVASRVGWAVTCREELGICGAEAGCGEAGLAETGGFTGSAVKLFLAGAEVGCDAIGCAETGSIGSGFGSLVRLIFTVDLAESAAYAGAWEGRPFAGAMQTGMALACDPDIEPLKCVLERIVPAHVVIVYEIVPPPVFVMFDAETHFALETGELIITE